MTTIQSPAELKTCLGPKFYMPIAVSLTFLLLISNLTVQKIIGGKFFLLTIGDLIYPLVYVLDGILIEVYGYALGRRVIWLALSTNIAFIIVIWLSIIAPHAAIWHHQTEYALILGQAARICFASFASFISGEFINSYIIAKLKVVTKGKHLWLRTSTAVLISQACDTTIFISIAFTHIIAFHKMLILLICVYLFKVAYQFVALPLIYVIAKFLKRQEKIDIFDKDTNFNPFKFGL